MRPRRWCNTHPSIATIDNHQQLESAENGNERDLKPCERSTARIVQPSFVSRFLFALAVGGRSAALIR